MRFVFGDLRINGEGWRDANDRIHFRVDPKRNHPDSVVAYLTRFPDEMLPQDVSYQLYPRIPVDNPAAQRAFVRDPYLIACSHWGYHLVTDD